MSGCVYEYGWARVCVCMWVCGCVGMGGRVCVCMWVCGCGFGCGCMGVGVWVGVCLYEYTHVVEYLDVCVCVECWILCDCVFGLCMGV